MCAVLSQRVTIYDIQGWQDCTLLLRKIQRPLIVCLRGATHLIDYTRRVTVYRPVSQMRRSFLLRL